MNEAERFAFGDPWKNPDKLFPSFMAELRLRYPEYEMVWDRQREQWACIHRIGPCKTMIVAYCEFGDGTPADPCQEFLDQVTACDVIRRFGNIEAYCDWLEKTQDDYDEAAKARMREEFEYARRPYSDYIAKGGPETIVLRPMDDEHRRQVERGLALSESTSPVVQLQREGAH